MKKAANKTFLFVAAWLLFTVGGCTDPNRIMDENTSIPNHNWAYVNNVKYHVKIDDVMTPYNLYFNLRVTGDYKYSNLFVLLHTTGPNMKPQVTRYELHLADKEGKWLGSGSGNLYSYQVSFKTGYFFPKAGTYSFEIEQNMRDNPLHDVSDVGMRIEKAK